MKKKGIFGKGKYKVLLGAAVLLVILAIAGSLLGLPEMLQSVRVEKTAAVRRDVTDTYREEGTITSGRPYQVLSEISGSVLEIPVRENDLVHAGDVLVRIDDRDVVFQKEQAENALDALRAQLDQSRIHQMMTTSPAEYLKSLEKELEAARAQYQSAKTSYQAAGALVSAGDIARVEYEEISAAYQNAAAQVSALEARYEKSRQDLEALKGEGIEEADLNDAFFGNETRQLEVSIEEQELLIRHLEEEIEKYTIRADRDGRVTALPAEEVSAVSPGQLTAVVQGTGSPGAEGDILTSIAPYLQIGDPVEVCIHLRGKDETYPAHISEIREYAEKGISALGLEEYRVHIRAEVDTGNADAAALSSREGYGADLKLTLYTGENVLTVPAGAVFSVDDRDYIYVIGGGRARKQEIAVLHRSASGVVIDESLCDLAEGTVIAARADAEGLYDGARVR